MGTHPIFESDFDCLTDEMAAHKELRKKLILAKKQKQIVQSPTGSATVLATPSSTTPRDATGAVPRLVSKSLVPISCRLSKMMTLYIFLMCIWFNKTGLHHWLVMVKKIEKK